MNFLLTSDRGNVDRRPGTYPCSYCQKAFNNSRALGGHLRSHQEEFRSRRGWNIPIRTNNSLNIISPTPNPCMTTQFEHISRGSVKNQSTYPSNAMPSLVFSNRLHTNENGWVNVSRFTENSTGNTTQCGEPNFSSAGGSAANQHFKPLSSAASVSTGCINPTCTPSDRPFLLGPEMVCQFNTDQSRSFRDGEQFSENALPNFQSQNQGNLCYPGYSVAIPDPRLGSNQLCAFKQHSSMVSLLPYQNQFSGREEYSRYSQNHILTHDGGKRRNLGEAPRLRGMMKRPKMNSNLTLETADKPQKKELLLFKDIEQSFDAMEISFDANEELKTDLDLSLHL